MRILVVEDEVQLAEAVARGLRREGMAVDVATDGDEGYRKAALTRYDVVVLDRDLPGMSGDEICRRLTDEGVLTRVMMLTASGTVEDKVNGLALGADDYLAKPFDPDELLARVRTVLRRVAGHAENGNGKALGNAVADAELTPRELEVLQLLADGMTQPQIARRIVISPRTVGTHIQNLLGKLDVHSRAQAVALAHRLGLVALTLDVVA
jgi:DNA-binding response OmpR family regulator